MMVLRRKWVVLLRYDFMAATHATVNSRKWCYITRVIFLIEGYVIVLSEVSCVLVQSHSSFGVWGGTYNRDLAARCLTEQERKKRKGSLSPKLRTTPLRFSF
jgi:hypothetical protein